MKQKYPINWTQCAVLSTARSFDYPGSAMWRHRLSHLSWNRNRTNKIINNYDWLSVIYVTVKLNPKLTQKDKHRYTF